MLTFVCLSMFVCLSLIRHDEEAHMLTFVCLCMFVCLSLIRYDEEAHMLTELVDTEIEIQKAVAGILALDKAQYVLALEKAQYENHEGIPTKCNSTTRQVLCRWIRLSCAI